MTTNPILRGFNPDPSIIRVGEDYYIATSTFEWFPGVQIHHSKDLVNWTLINRPLDSIEKLDIKGVPDSCGVWAPCLSYDNGIFYLVYSQVKSFDGMWKDTPNYLITSDDIMGPWSDPIFLDSSGFDGSLFHDCDGRKYYLSMVVDHRKGVFFGGIVLQEYDSEQQKLIGDKTLIFNGTSLGITEAPHLYQKDGYYYLITAEGGTEYGHAVSIARSKNILGPYEIHPNNPLVTAAHVSSHPLQKCGHADLVWTPEGDCYIVFLTGRPLTERGRCTLGRETAIDKILWPKNEWPTLVSGKQEPRIHIDELPQPHKKTISERIELKNGLNIHYQSLRIPITEEWVIQQKDKLRLIGRESLASTHSQSLLARRLQHFHVTYEIALDIKPSSFQHMAGLTCYYNTGHYFYLYINQGRNGGRQLNLMKSDNFNYEELAEPIALENEGQIRLKCEWRNESLFFYFRSEDGNWQNVASKCDGSILSDDYVRDGSDRYRPAFTGAFVGFCCQDLTGQGNYADFYEANYVEHEL